MLQSEALVEFFDEDLNLVHHAVTSTPAIDDDGQNPSESSFYIPATSAVSTGNFVRISGPYEWLGIVTQTPSTDSYISTVTVKPFVSKFDHQIWVSTAFQNNDYYGLEWFIANCIYRYHVSPDSDDDEQKTNCLSFARSVIDESWKTKNWTLGIKQASDDCIFNVVNLFSDVIVKALTKYAVFIHTKFDWVNKQIVMYVEPGNESVITIDADLPNVTIETFYTDSASTQTNTLELRNSTDLTSVIYYYLHTDHNYDTDKNTKRITPVVMGVSMVTPVTGSSDSSNDKDFATVAAEEAANVFDGIEWNNLIELSVSLDDALIKPLELKIGQVVTIIHNGYSYNSVLTGRKLSSTVTLIFGTVRLDLTKKL